MISKEELKSIIAKLDQVNNDLSVFNIGNAKTLLNALKLYLETLYRRVKNEEEAITETE